MERFLLLFPSSSSRCLCLVWLGLGRWGGGPCGGEVPGADDVGAEILSLSFCSVIQQWEQRDQALAFLPASVSPADTLLPCGFTMG